MDQLRARLMKSIENDLNPRVKRNEYLVIIPTYNEIDSIPKVIAGLFEIYSEVDVLVVDDNSPDGTADCIRGLQKSGLDKRLFLMQRDSKLGLGRAYIAGFNWGIENGYTYTAEMDADGSHQPHELRKLMQEVELNPEVDLVIGSRWTSGGSVANWPLSREVLSRCANLYSRFVLGVKVNDITAGFRIFRNSILKKIDFASAKSEGFSFQIEMTLLIAKNGGSIREVPINFIEREKGMSKMNFQIVLEAIVRVTIWGFQKRFGLFSKNTLGR
jgi:dolichol-phosphate mannosyltransferase